MMPSSSGDASAIILLMMAASPMNWSTADLPDNKKEGDVVDMRRNLMRKRRRGSRNSWTGMGNE
eukprot:5539798-Pyramimonas_sp.AAC.1